MVQANAARDQYALPGLIFRRTRARMGCGTGGSPRRVFGGSSDSRGSPWRASDLGSPAADATVRRKFARGQPGVSLAAPRMAGPARADAKTCAVLRSGIGPLPGANRGENPALRELFSRPVESSSSGCANDAG
ncbi:predicted protein [Streptomyces sp. AA4]|nr:predicted protein [Streptomyces sp. AA4]